MKRIVKVLIAFMMIVGLVACNSEVTGTLQVKSGAKDDTFNVFSESAVLVREVEMVQWFHDENGVRLVLANYHIDNFEVDGVSYVNPEFPYETKIFVGDATVSGKTVTSEQLSGLASLLKEEGKFTKIVNIPTLNPDYIVYNGSYTNATNDWALGEVVISFYALNDGVEVTVK